MDDVGFILLAYVATFGSTAALAWWVLRRGRVVGAQLPDDAMPWK